jgi:hypothetical protein
MKKLLLVLPIIGFAQMATPSLVFNAGQTFSIRAF